MKDNTRGKKCPVWCGICDKPVETAGKGLESCAVLFQHASGKIHSKVEEEFLRAQCSPGVPGNSFRYGGPTGSQDCANY
jgi:hypothetical protein